MPRIVGIAVKPTHRSPMQTLLKVNVTEEKGLEGDYCGAVGLFGTGKRQVTILSADQWELACRTLTFWLPWTTRRANLYVTDMSFGPEDVGKRLLVGDVELEITGETKPCRRMDEAHEGLRAALKPDFRAGVTCRVVKNGSISIGSFAQYI